MKGYRWKGAQEEGYDAHQQDSEVADQDGELEAQRDADEFTQSCVGTRDPKDERTREEDKCLPSDTVPKKNNPNSMRASCQGKKLKVIDRSFEAKHFQHNSDHRYNTRQYNVP